MKKMQFPMVELSSVHLGAIDFLRFSYFVMIIGRYGGKGSYLQAVKKLKNRTGILVREFFEKRR